MKSIRLYGNTKYGINPRKSRLIVSSRNRSTSSYRCFRQPVATPLTVCPPLRHLLPLFIAADSCPISPGIVRYTAASVGTPPRCYHAKRLELSGRRLCLYLFLYFKRERRKMSKFFAKVAGFFSNRTLMGVDKAGNRYFTKNEVIDGVTKEKRWVIFKVEQDPTSIPVEWICWLNGQRKAAPTTEEMLELEARRELVRQNVERLKKEEEERKAKLRAGSKHVVGKVGGPDLQSFLRQLPTASEGVRHEEASEAAEPGNASTVDTEKTLPPQEEPEPRTSEPTGSGPSFRPGTWQPPM